MLRLLTMVLAAAMLFVSILGCSRRSEEPEQIKRRFFENKEKLKATEDK